MKGFQYMMTLDAMERITRQYFCDHFDEVLDRVGKEDIGFVILGEDGKDKNVLCPARWFEFCYDDDFGCVVNSALRYAIRRKTYMPGVVVRFVRKYIQVLDLKTITVALRDIEDELKLGDLKDADMWEKLKDELEKQQAFLYERYLEQQKNERLGITTSVSDMPENQKRKEDCDTDPEEGGSRGKEAE